ncbi:hypothetical protein LWS67_13175 [Bacillus atrophaeus]|nr:hypothetical protein [Bacillus atrophaeus]
MNFYETVMKEALKDEGNRDTKNFESLGISSVRIKYRGGGSMYERTVPYFIWHFRLNNTITD